MNSKQYNDYQILRTIEQRSDVSQRLISKQTGINVASVNFAVKRLIQKGYVKATNMNKKRIMYHLTPTGISQKAKLAYNFFLRNYHLFSDIRETISAQIDTHPDLEGKNIAIMGINEISEIVYTCLQKREIHFAGIYEDIPELIGTKWMGTVVQSMKSLQNDGQVNYVVDAKNAAEDLMSLYIVTVRDFWDYLDARKMTEKDNKDNMVSEGLSIR